MFSPRFIFALLLLLPCWMILVHFMFNYVQRFKQKSRKIWQAIIMLATLFVSNNLASLLGILD